MFIYYRETEWDRVWAWEGQREGETQTLKQAPGSELSALRPMWGQNSNCEITTWAEVGPLTNWATQAPVDIFFKIIYFLKKFLVFIYFWERNRDRECEQGRGRERGRQRIWSRFQALSCQHRAPHGAWTCELWDPDLSWSQPLIQLNHPGAPLV